MAASVLNGVALTERECLKCHETKLLSEFNTWQAGKGKTGHRRICRDCEPEMQADYPQPGKESALLSTGIAFRVALPALPDGVGNDSLIVDMLSRLPTNRRWTIAEASRWKRMWVNTLDYLVVVTETAEAAD